MGKSQLITNRLPCGAFYLLNIPNILAASSMVNRLSGQNLHVSSNRINRIPCNRFVGLKITSYGDHRKPARLLVTDANG